LAANASWFAGAAPDVARIAGSVLTLLVRLEYQKLPAASIAGFVVLIDVPDTVVPADTILLAGKYALGLAVAVVRY